MSISELTEQLKSGAITLAQWHGGMRDFIVEEISNAMILAKGGREFVTQADWGFVGSQVKKQYQYLDKFAAEIQSNPTAWLSGNRINVRANLYGQLGYAALAEDIQREKEKAGYTEERRVLGPVRTEHCDGNGERPGCIEIEAKGWQPIGTLPKIGDAVCYTNCRCTFEYRKPDPERDGKWIYGDE